MTSSPRPGTTTTRSVGNEVLVERLAEPLRLQSVSPRADDAILHRAAVGHLRTETGWEPAARWAAGFAGTPAGSMLAMTAADLLGFARSHLDGDAAILSANSISAMQAPQAQVPSAGELTKHWGLGWAIEHMPGGMLIGHDGGTIGQSAYLRIAPGRDVAIALLTNGGRPDKLFRALSGHVFQELAGIDIPAQTGPPEHSEPVDSRRYAGRYESRMTRIDVEADTNGALRREFRVQNEFADLVQGPAPELDRIVRFSGETFMTIGAGRHETLTFIGDDGHGRAAFLHSGGRAIPRMPVQSSVG